MATATKKMSAVARTAALTALIENIAERYNIRVLWTGRKYRAYKKQRVIKLAEHKICTMAQLALALHEIGHIVGKQPKTRLEREYCAWQWAVDNTPIPFDRISWSKVHCSLYSYLMWAKARQKRPKVRPVIPPADHPMWQLLERARQESKYEKDMTWQN